LPNTLCHIGLQAPINRLFSKSNNLVWIIIACIIPDLPWITQRILIEIDLFNPYDLRLYCTTQASLAFCLILSGSLACFSRLPKKVFFLLAGNCLFHLLFDALQIKWANGVHLFIPFSWVTMHFDKIWPEHLFTFALTIFGAVYLALKWKQGVTQATQLNPASRKIAIAGLLLLPLYLFGPIAFMEKLEESGFYYIQTLREKDSRLGKRIEFDRAHYYVEEKILKIFSGERLAIVGEQPQRSGRVSLRGHFLTPSTVKVDSFHFHRDLRDLASIIGLFMACTLVFQSLILPKLHARKTQQGPS